MTARVHQSEGVLASPGRSLPLRQVFAVGLGNALEFYDWLAFSIFAVQIAHAFFPVGATSHGLVLTLATFGAGFITRPLGGIVIGALGDRLGRKPAMLFAFSLMGVAITGVALTPSYSRIGVAAPALLLLFRLLQGFALGGDVGPTTAYLIEAAPPHRRGLFVAMQSVTQGLAILMAGGIGFVLSALLDSHELSEWGWRLAFLLGASIVPLGLSIRRRLPETLDAPERASSRETRHIPARLIVIGVLMLGSGSIGTYVQGYIATFAQDTLHLAAAVAFGATVVSGLAMMVGDVLAGLCSDRLGRKPVMVGATLLLIVLVVPTYLIMIRVPSTAALLACVALLGMLLRLAVGPAIVSVTESLPRAARSGGLATLYAVAVAGFGGTTQFIIKALTDATGSPLAPAWYATGALIVGAMAMAMTHETAPVRSAGPQAAYVQ